MSWLLLHNGPAAALHARHSRIPAEDVPALSNTLELLARAEAIAAAMGAEAEAVRAAAAQDGYAEGLASGRDAACAELAAARAADAQTIAEAVTETRAAAADLALAVVRQIAGAIGPEAVLAGLAAGALARLAPGPVTVKVAPQSAEALARRLAEAGTSARVIGDAALGAFDLVIETPAMRALAGLDAQLGRIAAEWKLADAA